jgi:hypothetical protein
MQTYSEVPKLVTKVAYPFFTPPPFKDGGSNEFLRAAIHFAVKNKIFTLFYEGCQKSGIRLPEEADSRLNEYERRRKAQLETIEFLLDECSRNGIDVLFMKTFKPFDYVPDDVDLLLRHKADFKTVQKALRSKNFSLLKVGTPEIVMRKTFDGTFVDVDIHLSMAVGHLILFDLEKIWPKLIYKTLKSGHNVPVLPEYFETVRESAYSLLKDFKISVPALYSAAHVFLNNQLEDVWRLAEEENFCLHVYLFLSTASYLIHDLFSFQEEINLPRPKDKLTESSSRIIRAELSKGYNVPFSYPMSIIGVAYLSRVWSETRRNKDFKTLLQFIRQPSSKGIDLLLDYFRSHPSIA